MNAASEILHRAKLRRVVAHLDAHLDEELDLDTLAAIAGLSKHHFHRTFAGALGLSPRAVIAAPRILHFVHRIRLFPDVPEQETITDIFLPLE